jgi:hypothetical protein
MAVRRIVIRVVVLMAAGLAVPFGIACSSSSAGSLPGGDSQTSSGGSTADDTTTGGSSGGGTQSGSSATTGSGSSSAAGRRDAGTSAGDASAAGKCSDPNACDPHACTVCVPSDGGLDAAICVEGATATCGKNEAVFHCASQMDCASGESCCGSYDLTGDTVTTSCHPGSCPAALPLCTSGSVCQLCKTAAECSSGTCVEQSCNGSSVRFCSQNPFCTAQ